MNKKRAYTAPVQSARCTANVVLRDGSGAACMKPRRVGTLCWQHAPKVSKKYSISPEAALWAARYLTASNLGFGGPHATQAQIESLWRQCRIAHESDGVDVTPELRAWQKALRTDRWTRDHARKELPFLFEKSSSQIKDFLKL